MLLLEQESIKSVYIHIPFCKKICSYCDFCKMFYNEKFVLNYLNGLKKEVNQYYKGEPLDTLYIGGGTPSCLNENELNLLNEIISNFNLNKSFEFTFECNIEDISEELLSKLKSMKVNRLSIGIESFNKKILNTLGRKYNFDIKEKIMLAKRYFSNINIDLIYGVSGETLEDLKNDLEKIKELNINHVSIYSLILEDNTILKVNNYEEINEDLNREMYDYIVKYLESIGFIHYEISNFSKLGFESKHNMTYWDNEKYYGFGLGASGYVDNIRYTNTRSLTNYIDEKYRLEKEFIDKKTDMENYMILGLRKIKGVRNSLFKEKYGLNIDEVFDTSKLKYKDDFYYIDKDMIFISNSILSDFILGE